MSRLNLFIIHCKFFGKSKSFILRNAEMNNSDAWHWASCDLVAPLPQPGKPPLTKFSRPLAERHGITNVEWRESVSVGRTEVV
jgi:hypothetical protein